MIETYLQAESIQVEANTPPTASPITNVTLNTDYERCVGIALYPQLGGEIPNAEHTVQLSIADRSKDIIQYVPLAHLQASPAAGLEQKKRYHAVNITTTQGDLRVKTKLPQANNAKVQYLLVFLLERNKKA